MDLGTGDGRHVLARAAAAPHELVIGMDASATAMAESSRRASRNALTNVLFVVADATELPDGLAGFADTVTIHFPWGSLLRAAMSADPAITRLLVAGGQVRLLLSASANDGSLGLDALDPAALETTYRRAGLSLISSRTAKLDDAVAAHSSWGKRLLRNPAASRVAWLLEAQAPPDAGSQDQ